MQPPNLTTQKSLTTHRTLSNSKRCNRRSTTRNARAVVQLPLLQGTRQTMATRSALAHCVFYYPVWRTSHPAGAFRLDRLEELQQYRQKMAPQNLRIKRSSLLQLLGGGGGRSHTKNGKSHNRINKDELVYGICRGSVCRGDVVGQQARPFFFLLCVSFIRKSNNHRVTIYQEAGFPLVSAYCEGGS